MNVRIENSLVHALLAGDWVAACFGSDMLSGDRVSGKKGVKKKMNLFSKLRGMRTLLVDDDEWIRDSLSLFFESEGCHLLALETAEEALEEINRQAYDIIITDYKMPGMDGLEFLERINSFCPDALWIMITAYGSKDVFLKARKARVQEFIDKPFTIKTIEDSLSRLIRNLEQKDMDADL